MPSVLRVFKKSCYVVSSLLILASYSVCLDEIQSGNRVVASRLLALKDSVNPKHGNFSHLYSDSVSDSKTDIYEFSYQLTNQTTAVRISTTTNGSQSKSPVMFVIRQEHGIMSWPIPLVLEYLFPYSAVERTLCPVEREGTPPEPTSAKFYVEVATMFKTNIDYTLEAKFITDFFIMTGESKVIASSPAKPVYYLYKFPEGVSNVLVRATSQDALCMTLSIQQSTCPVFDLDSDVDFEGTYQTMTKQGAIVVGDTFGASFFVVLVVKPNDGECKKSSQTPLLGALRQKNITVTIEKTISSSQYYKATLAAVALFLAFYIVALFIGIFYHGCKKNWGIMDLRTAADEDDTEAKTPINPRQGGRSYGAAPISQEIAEVTGDYPTTPYNPASHDDISVDSLNSEDFDFLNDANKEKKVFRTKTALFVCDMARKSEKRQSKNYRLYTKNLLTIAIFYGLPVLQLVLTYQQVLNVTGDQDICYYNFACAHPLKNVSSFNNIFSNIGYVMLGILFLILVARRDFLYKKAVEKAHGHDQLYGIPQHYGLFYAMGMALVMEGFMSACYHVCPTVSNFQFDTSFMYIIACLCILKIYQNRHPDISAKAHTSYMVMAFVIIVAVVGVVYGTNVFWIIFALLYIFSSLMLSIHLYYLGQWQLDRYLCKRLWILIRTDWVHCNKPLYPNRMVLLLLGNLVNWAIAIYGLVTGFPDFASFLLGIFIGNLLLYTSFYIIMKLLSKERIPLLTISFILMSMVCWAFALYFFVAHLTSWQLTPAESREGNKECIVMDFYDAHDVWHFLSSISLFFSFLVLLTLDDEIIFNRRDQIPVF